MKREDSTAREEVGEMCYGNLVELQAIEPSAADAMPHTQPIRNQQSSDAMIRRYMGVLEKVFQLNQISLAYSPG